MERFNAFQLPPPKRNNRLFFKHFSIMLALLLGAGSALAFGGGGGRSAPGLISTTYKAGVDAIGVHFGGDADIPCPEHSTKIQGLCFCDEYYTPDGVGGCVADMCLEYEPTDCLPDCDPITGEALAGNEGGYCNNKTGRCSLGVCLNIICNPCEDLVDGLCVARTCGTGEVCNTAQNACLCDTANKYYGDAGNCQLCNQTGTIFKNTTCQCDNENDYYGEIENCATCDGDNREIKDNDCVCINGYEEFNNECVEKCASGYFRNQETGQCELGCTTNSDCTGLDACMGCVIPDGADSGTCQYACQEVEYLESTGTQWIDTGWYLPSQSDSFELNIDVQGVGGQVNWATFCGVNWGNNGELQYYLFQFTESSINSVTVHNSDAQAVIASFDIETNSRNTYRMTYNNQVTSVYLNHVLQNTDTYDISSRGTTPMYLFTSAGRISDAQRAKIKMYSCSIKQDGTLVRDFIPVLDPDGVPAMLDRVENKLYYNQGTGQFKTNKDE